MLRKGVYPEKPNEKGYGEVPHSDTMDPRMAPQCPIGYDGPTILGMSEDEPQNPWFWTSTHCVVSWPDAKEVASFDTIAEIQGDDALRGLDREISAAMRQDKGILGYKVITRKPETHIAKGEEHVARIRKMLAMAQGKLPELTPELERRLKIDKENGYDVREITESCPELKALGRTMLKEEAAYHLGKAATWKLWDTVIEADGRMQPCVMTPQADGTHEPVIRPELSISARIIHAIRRKAQKKASTRTAIAFIDPDVLNADLRRTIGEVIPGRGHWAIQVWFDPYDCGISRIEAAATAAMPKRGPTKAEKALLG